MAKDPKLSLDVDAPDRVSSILRDAADAYRESAIELEAAWQERGAGRPWNRIANVLDRAAVTIERELKKLGY